MFQKRRWAKLVLCLGLEAAAFMGALIRPDEIEDLLRYAQQARIERRVSEETGGSGSPLHEAESGSLEDEL